MTRSIRKMPTPLGVGPGQTASVTLPLGLTYERLIITMNVNSNVNVEPNDWKDYIEELRLIVDGDTKIAISGKDLVKLNQYYGQTLENGALPLFLSRPWARTMGGEDATAYGTAGGMSSFALELDLAAGQTYNSVEVYAMQSPGRPFGSHLRIQRYTVNQGVEGEAQIADLPRGPWAMCAMHIDTGNISDVELVLDDRVVMDTSKLIRKAQGAIVGRVDQDAMTHIDLMPQNRLSDAMPMAVQDFRLKATFTATGSFNIYAETIRSA